MKILVLDGNENQAVACVRSLASAGHNVHVGATTTWSKAGWSRFCAGTFIYPGPQQDTDGFISRIVEEIRGQTGTLVLPMTERTTLSLSIHREVVMSAGGLLVLPCHETVIRAFDKQATTDLASSLGITVPQTTLLTSDADPQPLAKALEYPVVLKPQSSEEISAQGQTVTTGAPSYARNADEFMEAFATLRTRCSAIVVQNFIAGKGVGYFALTREGALRAEFAHQRIRDVRPTGSGSSLRVSVNPSPHVRGAALAILQALNWHGVAMVEFRMLPDGTPVFLEVNGRFWNSLPLAVYAKADFPALLARMVEQGDVPMPTKYIEGLRCRWLLGDFRHLLEVWRGAPKGYPSAFPGRWRTLWEFLRPVRGTYHDNFTLQDPLPELGDWLDFILRRLPSGLKKNSKIGNRFNVQGSYSRT